MNPKVTVLLTSYNHAKFLTKSIDSVLNQTFKDFELVIVDDCSTDNSWEIIKKYKDKRIRKIRNRSNKGSILTRELVESFRGEYYAVAHCDDCWKKTKLQKQVDYLESNPNVAACFTYVKLIDESSKELETDKYVNFNVDNKNHYEWLNYFFYHGNCLCNPSLLMRKNVQLDLDLFVHGLKSLPDYYRWVKLCLTQDIYVYPEKLTMFRVRRNALNTSGYNYNNIVRIAYEELKILELYLQLSEEDFLKVFPTAKKYLKKGNINIRFALARICIDESGKDNYRLFGLNLLYDLLQDKDSRLELEKKYNYTKKDFTIETGEKDIFKIIEFKKIHHASLYINYRENYKEENSIKLDYLEKKEGKFEILFNINDDNIKEVRFDPDENCYRCYYNIEIYINNKKIDNFYTNCSIQKENKYYFYHNDPSFYIPVSKKLKTVYITGEYEDIDIDDYIEYTADTKLKEYIDKKKFINRIKKHLLSIFIK